MLIRLNKLQFIVFVCRQKVIGIGKMHVFKIYLLEITNIEIGVKELCRHEMYYYEYGLLLAILTMICDPNININVGTYHFW